jgi:ketosteroid isomerase-like protein
MLPLRYPDPDMSTTASEVLAALEVWRQAMLSRDVPALDSVLHPDVTYSHSNAFNESKADAIAGLPTCAAQSIEVTEPTVRIYGDTALLKADVDFRNLIEGDIQHVPLNVLHVFVKTDAGWQMVGRQATRRA